MLQDAAEDVLLTATISSIYQRRWRGVIHGAAPLGFSGTDFRVGRILLLECQSFQAEAESEVEYVG